MISDTLFEAISEIEKYQRTFPEVYDRQQEEICAVVNRMRELHEELDGI